MSDDTKTIPHSNVITEENTLKFDGFGFFSWVRLWWVEMNGIIKVNINIDEHEEHEEEEEEDLSRTA